LRHGVEFDYEIADGVQHISGAPTLELLLHPQHDLCLPVLLPCNFAVYANDLVNQTQAAARLKERKIFEPPIPAYNFLGQSGDEKEGLFIWKITPDRTRVSAIAWVVKETNDRRTATEAAPSSDFLTSVPLAPTRAGFFSGLRSLSWII
jgi:hypothetical protein